MNLIGLAIASVFLIIISFVQRRMQFNFSDHYYHVGLIESIKKNRHRFVLEHPNFMVEENFAYPQFYHWLLSFFPPKVYARYFFLLNLTFSWLFLLTTFLLAGHLFALQGVAGGRLLQGCVILVVATTPFLYLPWNAKNLGLSTRTFGFIAVTVLNFSLLFYKLDHSVIYSCFIVFSICVCILSSQMAHQYFLLGLIPLSIVISPMVLAFYAISIALCFLVSPKVFKKYIAGQFWHKYIFSKYLVKEYVLSGRPSIWLDFFGGFLKKFRINFKLGIIYFYSNPFLLLIWAIPVLLPAYYFGYYRQDAFSALLGWFNGIGLLLFLLTSFRFTRFLGEPERYVEFFIPTITVQLFYSVPAGKLTECLSILVVYSIVVIAILLVIEFRSVSKTSARNQEDVDRMFSLFLPSLVDEKTLISNSWHVMRRFYGTDVKTFTPNFTGLKTGDIPLTEMFKKSFIYLDAGILPLLRNGYSVTYCIIEKNKPGYEEWEMLAEKEGNRLLVCNQFSLYKLR